MLKGVSLLNSGKCCKSKVSADSAAGCKAQEAAEANKPSVFKKIASPKKGVKNEIVQPKEHNSGAAQLASLNKHFILSKKKAV